ncbi:tRNA (N6-threonylcarbamoyladenosine(37)-N6)-methyltransferase TrmO [bacterium]|nr:tRNA (N6-threonylcarbamoyladenosine(37)-N6)-methyltransferase TrmO [bacterium]
MKKIEYTPIGIIHSPFKEPKGVPIQAAVSKEKGTIEIFPEYEEGLKDLDKFSHIILIFHFHLSKKGKLLAIPYMDTKERGIFSIRGPSRPNPIGISTVKLLKIAKNILFIENVDIVDGTPLLDIKPYIPKFDNRDTENIGWLKGNIQKLPNKKDDGRFRK